MKNLFVIISLLNYIFFSKLINVLLTIPFNPSCMLIRTYDIYAKHTENGISFKITVTIK